MKKLIYILMLLSVAANAESLFSNSTKVGLEIEGLGDSSKFVRGMMFGLHGSQYVRDSNVSIGLAMDMGSPNGNQVANDNLGYGGLTIGYDNTWGRIIHYETNLEVGYGLGSYGQSPVIKPDIGAGLNVVNGYRMVFSIGYLYMPSMPQGSGLIMGIKIDRKTFGDSSPDNR